MSEEMEHNHQTVKKASNSIKNNVSNYSKYVNHDNVLSVSCSTKNVERLCNEVANKNKKQLKRM